MSCSFLMLFSASHRIKSPLIRFPSWPARTVLPFFSCVNSISTPLLYETLFLCACGSRSITNASVSCLLFSSFHFFAACSLVMGSL